MNYDLRCVHCKFLGEVEVQADIDDKITVVTVDVCRYNPPTINNVVQEEDSRTVITPQSGWPIVDAKNDWCGKLEQADGRLVITKNKEPKPKTKDGSSLLGTLKKLNPFDDSTPPPSESK